MIYDFPPTDSPIRQGDIFLGLPRVEISLRQIPLITESGEQRLTSWRDIAQAGDETDHRGDGGDHGHGAGPGPKQPGYFVAQVGVLVLKAPQRSDGAMAVLLNLVDVLAHGLDARA